MRRERGLDIRQGAENIGHDRQGGRISGFLDRQQNASLSILADDVGLYRVAVTHIRDVPNVNGAAVNGSDGEIVQCLHGRRIPIEADVVLGAPNFCRSRGQDHVLRVHGVHDIRR